MATDDSNAPFRSGLRVGRYQPIRRIAVGGMAELYLACAVGPGDFRKVVALKRLLPQHALDPQLLQMFLDEARLMARMAHPHIPQVYDVDDGSETETERAPYFAMEYVHGTDLRGLLNESDGPVPIPQLLAVGAAVSSGLHYAHEMATENGEPLALVHRDVSPSNVLISFGGSVKVTDFGVAKWSEQRSRTYVGQLKGKFAHMSPEQCQGQPLDRRSDVFALGTLLYEMATGRPAFAADSDFELMSRIVNVDVLPPARAGAPLPADLSAIILRALRRSREERTASAQEVQLELESFAREHRLDTSPLALAAYLETLFSARVTEWRAAMESGFTLAEHLQRSPAGGGSAAGAATRTATDAHIDSPRAPAGDRAAAPAVAPARGRSRSGAVPSPRVGARRVAVGIGTAGIVVSLSALGMRLASAPGGAPTFHATTSTLSAPPPAPSQRDAVPLASPSLVSATPMARLRDEPRDAVATSSSRGGPARGEVARTGRPRVSGKARPAPRHAPEPGRIASASDEVAPPRIVPAAPTLVPSPPAERVPPTPDATAGGAPSRSVRVWDPDSPVPP